MSFQQYTLHLPWGQNKHILHCDVPEPLGLRQNATFKIWNVPQKTVFKAYSLAWHF